MKPSIRRGWRQLLASVGALLAATSALADTSIDILVLARPPYYEVVDGQPRGFLLSRAARILARAGVTVGQYEVMPPRRILATLQRNAAPQCSVGWFKTAAREAFARYSVPIHQDQPHVVMTVRPRAPAILAKKTLLTLMDDPDLRLGLVDGYSYGNYLDAMIGARHGPVDTRATTPARLLDALAEGRVDFILIDHEEAGYLKALHRATRELVEVPLLGMPNGQARYLICNQRVDAATMSVIDRAIAAELAQR